MTGSPTPARTRARPSTSSPGTGCSTSSTPRSARSSARITVIASSGVHPWFASRRIVTVGPTAWRTARTRATSVAASVPTFIFRVEKPSATRCPAAAARSSAEPADSVTSVRRTAGYAAVPGRAAAPVVGDPRKAGRVSPARRATRSRTAVSTAALAPKLRATACCTSVRTSPQSSTSRSTTTGASICSTHAVAPASDSPVTCQTWGASPQPVVPSESVSRMTTVSVVVVRRSAVTNGVCRGTERRAQTTDANREGIARSTVRQRRRRPSPGAREPRRPRAG